MIKMLRLDDRLIHGQIAIRWSRAIAAKMIVIANDEIVKDKTQVMVLKMSAPADMRSTVLSIEDTIKNVTDPRARDMNIMILTNNFRDTLAIAKATKDVCERVNLGNNKINYVVGMKPLTQYVYVNDDDVACIREMIACGIHPDCQLRPEFPMITAENALKSLK